MPSNQHAPDSYSFQLNPQPYYVVTKQCTIAMIDDDDAAAVTIQISVFKARAMQLSLSGREKAGRYWATVSWKLRRAMAMLN
jgi:hypothetical protein